MRKTGEEEFKEDGVAIAKLSEYWQWSASDLLGNTERGRLTSWRPPSALLMWGQKTWSKIIFGIRPTRAWDGISLRLRVVTDVQASYESRPRDCSW